tara:strand:+ start:331 stop:552 length:222 start_codon:yes stop_codon:yes gene_type:complete
MDITDVLGLDTLLAQMILAIGAAMVFGNGFAVFQHKKGRGPDRAKEDFHPARAWWLLSVGLMISIWGIASLFV